MNDKSNPAMIGSIKHQFRVIVESNNPISRAVGIMMVAEMFEDAGVHLASDLNVYTSRYLSEAISAGVMTDLKPATVVATMADNPMPGWQPGMMQPGMMGGWPGMTPPIFMNPRMGQMVDPAPGYNGGDIPGYEHNPLAAAEHIPQPRPLVRGAGMVGASIIGNWPNPLPINMRDVTHVTRLDNDDEAGLHYGIYGFGVVSGWKRLTTVSLVSHYDKDEGPNNPRIEDYLLICADHLDSLRRSNKASQAQDAAYRAVMKALNHLHGDTQEKFLSGKAATTE